MKKIKRRPRYCSHCKKETPRLLLLTVGGIRRERTEAEATRLDLLKETGADMRRELFDDSKRRRVRLCPKCVKELS